MTAHTTTTKVQTIKSVRVPVGELKYTPGLSREGVLPQLVIDGQRMDCAPRFRDSMLGLIGQSASIFNLFSADEVFERVQSRSPSRQVSINYEEGTNRVVSMTNHSELLDFGQLCEYVIGDSPVTYEDGVVRAMLGTVRSEVFTINGDDHLPRINMQIPLDGYGTTSSWLALLRQVCSNGMVGMAPAFRCVIKLGGDSPIPTLRRFAKSFFDEDGYSDIRTRLETAAKTPASLAEFTKLLELSARSQMSLNILNKLDDMVSGTQEYYGLSSLKAIDKKRARLVPTKVSVYDLVNMSSELATHVAEPRTAMALQGNVGDLLSSQFDLEGLSCEVDTAKRETFFVPTGLPERSGMGRN